MSFIRSTALRASSFARATRPTRYIRTAELQPWQRAVQRRAYASAHGAHGEAKSSDVPWAAGAAAGTAVGLYLVITQDFGHGESHDDHHAKEHDEEEAPAEDSNEEEPKEESKDEAKTESKDEKKDEPKDNKKDESKDEKKSQPKKDDGKEGKAAEQKKDESKAASPDKSDKPDPTKESKSQNEMSGKQEGLSNADTHHSTDVSNQDDKSKKGEGVAETAKLKGTVSTDRPAAENKEERGKAQSSKDA
ncbi:uncharacterized protein K460DRAFT_352227 [Cucurbitaria berberidis CBS 394.84]|uniref:Cylicin I n=1 Tax=Cucurbitaria berberidis CBS 394.84 TaxID=1168544 RepID=A0A9P4LAB8_9PLEO|nr:uncharacterized protein K460DRAFT_352227 [Cucurbitaria berberidis CBS 394.84]KAF1847039.1 hypothetical protein K460DRAFT_352227 [Cucurbitaria berberidis CBS 394.84]